MDAFRDPLLVKVDKLPRRHRGREVRRLDAPRDWMPVAARLGIAVAVVIVCLGRGVVVVRGVVTRRPLPVGRKSPKPLRHCRLLLAT